LQPAAASRPAAAPVERVVEPIRLRKPRWTPDVGYAETTDVDLAGFEDDAAAADR